MRGRIAVVGARGFIGNRVVEVLRLLRHSAVRAVVRQVADLSLSARFGFDGKLDYAIADASDFGALMKALEGCDVAIDATSAPIRSIAGNAETVYRAADAAGCGRVVYLSSAMVYGQAPPPDVDERTPLSLRQPIPYNTAKIQAEQRLRKLRQLGRAGIVLLRPGIVYGPRSKWITRFAESLLDGNAFLVDGGLGVCNAIYVDNLVDAILLAAVNPEADGEAFLLGERSAPSWRALYEPVAESMGYTMSDVASVPSRAVSQTLRERADALRLSTPVQWALRRLPPAARAGLGAFWAASGARREDSVAIRLPTLEESLLQTSRHLPSWNKAERLLGYAPAFERDEAMRRTISWLSFAGYPVKAERPGGSPVR